MSLTSRCGHHCGISASGETVTEGHCSCSECHAGAALPAQSQNRTEFRDRGERGAAA